MVELAAPSPQQPSSALRILKLLAIAAGAALVSAGVTALHYPKLVVTLGAKPERQAFTYPRPHEPLELTRLPRDAAAEAAKRRAERAAALEALRRQSVLDSKLSDAAAQAFDRGIFTSSPGGVFATAARVAQWKPLIVRASRGSGISPNLIEAMVFVESSGYRDAVGGGRRVGLFQLTPWQARSLGVQVDRVRKHSRLLASVRHRVDNRYRAVPSIRAAVRYLVRARRTLGRADLAVASFHVGVRNLAAASGGEKISYASLYFGSAPDRNAGIWRRLNREGDVARDYYWRVLAAQRVLKLYRHNRAALSWEDVQQARKSSAEEVMHPASSTLRFHRPRDLVRAWKRHQLVRIPTDARKTHIAISGTFGQMAPRLGRSKKLYLGLRPSARNVLLFIGKRVHELSGSRPLILTSAVRDDVYQRALTRVRRTRTRCIRPVTRSTSRVRTRRRARRRRSSTSSSGSRRCTRSRTSARRTRSTSPPPRRCRPGCSPASADDYVNVRMWNSSTSSPFVVHVTSFAMPSCSSKTSTSSEPVSSQRSS
jgi:soluble lytic murein transglycosylase-like protein